MSTYRPKILIVDDSEDICRMMVDVLNGEGYELYCAHDGRDGLTMAASIHPDLIFLDMVMPVLDGIGFLKEMNRADSFICPVIAISAFQDDEVLTECYDQGIFSLIRKPFQISEILALSRRYTNLSKIRNRLSFNLDTVAFLSRQAASFGLDNVEQRDLIEAIPLPIFVKNRERIIVQVNRSFEEYTGLSREQVSGKNCTHIMSEGLRLALDHDRELTLSGQSDVNVLKQEHTISDPHGTQREVLVYRSVITGPDNGAAGILGIMIDITEFGFSSFKKMLATQFPQLSAREREVANLVRLGMSNKEISQQLNVALCTVEYHRTNLREKLGLKKGASLTTALLALQQRSVDSPGEGALPPGGNGGATAASNRSCACGGRGAVGCAATTPRSMAEELAVLRGNGEKILVVDDDAMLSRMAVEMLQLLGYVPVAVGSGEEAVAYLQKSDAHLLILDMAMGLGMNGRQTYEEILSFKPAQRAIVATGFAESHEVARILQLGVGWLVKKPYSAVDLGQAIKKALGQAEQ